jgi:hypothetical protein
MTRHARTAILLGSWLLMLPPSETKIVDGRPSVTVDTEAPIIAWKQESAYDTARACEAGKASLANIVIPPGMERVFIAARCVRAESVRPPQQRSVVLALVLLLSGRLRR